MGTQRKEHQNQRTSQERATADVDDELEELQRCEKSFSSSSFSSSSCALHESPTGRLGPASPAKPCGAAQVRLAETPVSSSFSSSSLRTSNAGGGRRPAGRRAPHGCRGAQAAVAQKQSVSAEGKSVVAPGHAAPESVRTPGRPPDLVAVV